VHRIECVIPARNEEKYLPKTSEALVSQTIRPTRVIVINDGSTDTTGEVASKFGFETVCVEHRKPREKGSPELAQLFNKGLEQVSPTAEYVMILGADHVLPNNYIERVIGKMKQQWVSLASGVIAGEAAVTPRGSGRIADVKDWKESIGRLGFPLCYGFETYIVLKMMMKGFKVAVYRDILSVTQRRTGGTTDYVSYGRGMRFLGYTPEYLSARALITAVKFRDLSKAAEMLAGYLSYHMHSDVSDYMTLKQRTLLVEYARSPRRLLARAKASFGRTFVPHQEENAPWP